MKILLAHLHFSWYILHGYRMGSDENNFLPQPVIICWRFDSFLSVNDTVSSKCTPQWNGVCLNYFHRKKKCSYSNYIPSKWLAAISTWKTSFDIGSNKSINNLTFTPTSTVVTVLEIPKQIWDTHSTETKNWPAFSGLLGSEGQS